MISLIIDKTDRFFALGMEKLLEQHLKEKFNGLSFKNENDRNDLRIIIAESHLTISLGDVNHDNNKYIHIPFFYKKRSTHLILDKIISLIYFIDEKKNTIKNRNDVLNMLGNNKYKQLSLSERELLCALGSGESINSIALRTQRAIKTVQTHYRHACMKLGAINQAEVLTFARFIHSKNNDDLCILIT